MKHEGRNFLQLSRRLFNDPKYQCLSNNAKWLYVVLKELEHKFSGKKIDYFFRSDNDLASDANLSLRVLKRAKKELKEAGVVETWLAHWIDPETKKKSEKHITGYRIN